MKRHVPAWSLGTIAVVLAGIVAVPSGARGQDIQRTGDEVAQRSATPPPPAPPPAPPPPPSPPVRTQAPSTERGSGSVGRDSGRRQDRPVPRDGDRIDRQRGSNDPVQKVANVPNGPGRRRDGLPKTGEAVARTEPPQAGGGHGGNLVVLPADAYGPWALAYGGLYAYDPWYGADPIYAPSTSSYEDAGSLRLKVKPAEASVYVDGYYVGGVDDFDGIFQRLRIEPGPHRIEIREAGYEPLTFDVRIDPDHTTTYRGELEKRQTQN